MPELPEVQTVVSTLRPLIVGRTIGRVTVSRADILCPPGVDLPARLRGRAIADVARRGKRIVVTLGDGNRFYVHLGMTGRLTVVGADAQLDPHTHLLIDIGRMQLRFRDPRRFGGLWWLGTDTSPDAGMGPEPLTLSPGRLAQLLRTTRRAVKVALLDQRLIAGLGNIYVDEALHAAKIHPTIPSNELVPDDVGRLCRAVKTVLRRAIRHRGSTLRDYADAEGNAGVFQKLHRVYDRAELPCQRCRTPIERIVLGGRSTHFCPACQRRPGRLEVRRVKSE